SASTRIAWKEETLDYWHEQAASHGRSLWITEMQATPWIGTTGFTVDNLVASALAYRGHGVSVYLLWGVENWLDSAEWMRAGIEPISLLRRRCRRPLNSFSLALQAPSTIGSEYF